MNDFKRYLVHISGIVQGVGMRPYIYNTAKKHKLGGFVSNQGSSVSIEISGNKVDIHKFLVELLEKPPIGSMIDKVKIKPMDGDTSDGFFIIDSSREKIQQGLIPPDMAICDDCIREMLDRRNRRYLYPFTNCTACGPRYSIIRTLPYDRENTSMSDYKMCTTCKDEYESPDDRRFHAQTNCCPECGPKLTLLDKNESPIACSNPVLTARQLLYEGKLLAIKGLGGYHIACNGQDEKAIGLLRNRKRRPDKPLAIMAANLEAAKLICYISEKEGEILVGRQKPIVLLDKKYPQLLPENIAPGINRLGVMLPYTPLHHLLFHEQLRYLVMTSGNTSGMSISYRDEDALERLKCIADYFMVHDREILTPVDDSLVRVFDGNEMISRNSRGYSPTALKIDSESDIIAAGAEQKSSLCLVHKGYAHTSQYLGNLEDMSVYEEYLKLVKRMNSMLDTGSQIIAHDLHTGYLSTQWAIEQSTEKIPIQHHQAHMAACMAEYNLRQDAIGIIYDGTGLGTDGAIWGGEFFVGTIGKYTRVGQWEYVKLQGGDSTIREPWKTAASYLYAIGVRESGYLYNVSNQDFKAVQNSIKHNLNCFESSSIGRLFDCVAALVLQRMHITYDAQGPIELESAIKQDVRELYPYAIDEKEEKLIIGYEGIILGILQDLKSGKGTSYISAKFHNTVCEATVECACKIRTRFPIDNIVLGGGVFENVYLLKNIIKALKQHSFHIYYNRKVPVNDGGVAFGQVAIAAKVAKEGTYVSGCSF
ncbi:MAG: carbamoyltransferase HypF [Anaerolineaceae bacterium]|nr:MAG: carbamoyltransferase HypF [Anaerolineaceae bacterium]